MAGASYFASDSTGLKQFPTKLPDSMAWHHLVMYSELVASSRRSLSWGAARKTESDKIGEKRAAPELIGRLEDATELIKHLCRQKVVYNIMYRFILATDEVNKFECLTKKNKRLSFKVVQLNHFFVSNQIKLIEH